MLFLVGITLALNVRFGGMPSAHSSSRISTCTMIGSFESEFGYRSARAQYIQDEPAHKSYYIHGTSASGIHNDPASSERPKLMHTEAVSSSRSSKMTASPTATSSTACSHTRMWDLRSARAEYVQDEPIESSYVGDTYSRCATSRPRLPTVLPSPVITPLAPATMADSHPDDAALESEEDDMEVDDYGVDDDVVDVDDDGRD